MEIILKSMHKYLYIINIYFYFYFKNSFNELFEGYLSVIENILNSDEKMNMFNFEEKQ